MRVSATSRMPPQADAGPDESSAGEGARDSQAGRGTQTHSGGGVDEQVARLQAAEEASSEEDDEQPPDASHGQVGILSPTCGASWGFSSLEGARRRLASMARHVMMANHQETEAVPNSPRWARGVSPCFQEGLIKRCESVVHECC